ncbi:MAG: 50S ribosomal protein L4 [Candidatus Wildermuthbacteria bacterium GWA2_46_15]|uniref:Large ribosomal subunit protein uL4 n=1 Tax=Candidatus Wildermuthbacteria bacterium GWA2_46_15 TaxID=1802443 RepID=A0A1G2QQQ5_9BACT|nr:MAG: 50S ribosomal protein L4 [Candidatus Wildermuthbacteria bacterium GWA2_46_15]
MFVKTYNQSGEETGKTLLPKAIFEVKVNSDLLHQVVRSQMANQRQGTAHTKTRSEVRGGGKKPWRQKGTGRARHASIRSPLWRGGGIIFGPTKDKIYKQKINRKMARKALLMTLSGKAEEQELVVLDDLKMEEAKTKEMAKMIQRLRSKVASLKKGSLLFILPEKDEKVIRAIHNLSDVETIEARNINALKILSFKNLIMTKETISAFKKLFSQKNEVVENE